MSQSESVSESKSQTEPSAARIRAGLGAQCAPRRPTQANLAGRPFAQVRDLGYTPYCASCYDEALDQLHTAPVVFDAALLDLDLAGESGWDIAENLSAYYPDIRRVVMSGRYHPGQLDLATTQGLAHARLAKPWTEDDLVDALRPKPGETPA